MISPIASKVKENIEKVIVCKDSVVDLALVAVLCEGHILIEDVPGVGKTTLAKTIARTLGCSFRRIQFTPDLLPSDVTGLYFFNQKTSEFEFRPGPVQANIVLADEINRATPRTQSSLMECMEERQITVDGETKPLPRPFLIIATQNPIELEGTFPLPEAQLDRFLLRIRLGYPSEKDEGDILIRFGRTNPLDGLTSVTSATELLLLMDECRAVYVEETVRQYIVRLSRAVRSHPAIALGASPRATLGLYRASQALAAIRGRSYVIPDDVKTLAVPVLSHRLIINPQDRVRGRSSEAIVEKIVTDLPVLIETEGASM